MSAPALVFAGVATDCVARSAAFTSELSVIAVGVANASKIAARPRPRPVILEKSPVFDA